MSYFVISVPLLDKPNDFENVLLHNPMSMNCNMLGTPGGVYAYNSRERRRVLSCI